jgi:hypothetical protein
LYTVQGKLHGKFASARHSNHDAFARFVDGMTPLPAACDS